MWMRFDRVTRAITGTLAMTIATGVVALVGYQSGTNVSAEEMQAAPQGQPSAQGRGQGRGGGRAGGPQGGAPVPFDSRVGYTQIFNGTSLDGWDGDPAFWRRLARESYRRLIHYAEMLSESAPADEPAWRSRLEAYLQLADWDLVNSANGAALDEYAQVHEMLEAAENVEALMVEIFAPPIPRAFRRNG